MEDLHFNANPRFTQWVVSKTILQEPFVVLDVGVQGDANPRWNFLGDHLVLHGFDPIAEVIDGLIKSNAGRRNRHYHNLAIGQTDEQTTFYFDAVNPTASSMYSQGPSRFERQSSEQARHVTMRKLDTLYEQGVIPAADFLKVDVEGYEKNVFLGARTLLAAGNLSVETETNFGISPTYPRSHFSALSDILVEHGLTAFDLGFDRIPRATFTQALQRLGIQISPGRQLGKPATFNFLFCRDAIDERDSPHHYINPPQAITVDQIIKLMIIYELHGLNDIALDTAVRLQDTLSVRFDVGEAVDMLARGQSRTPATEVAAIANNADRIEQLEERLRVIERSTSWRITAPLRTLKNHLLARKA
jgi:FkbM family methyltransferase